MSTGVILPPPVSPKANKKGVAPDRPARPRWKAASHWGLALFDQAVVSGSRFLITIIIGRAAGPVDLGRYAVAFYVLVLLGCAQEALITTPYAVCAPRLRTRSRGALGDAAVALHGLFVTIVVLVGLIAIAAAYLVGSDSAVLRMTVALTIAAPLSLVWEFARRMMLARLRVASATLVDAVSAILQVAALIVLALLGRMDGATAMAALGLGCALPGLVCMWQLRPQRAPQRLAWYWLRNWHIGKWIMGSQMARALSSVIPIWLLAGLAGDPAAGIFAACISIPMISNPFIFAIGNLLMPKAAHAFASEGVSGVIRLVLGAIAAAAVPLAPLGLAMILAGESILELMYGSQYSGNGPTLAVLGLCPMIWAATSILACGQAALRQTRASFIATMSGIITSAAVIAALASSWQVLGAAVGLVTGTATICFMQCWQFTRRCRELAERQL